MQQTPPLVPFHILLADDDQDDRYFFSKAVEELPLQTQLTMVEDGAKLMTYLNENSVKLPDVLFLDYNMPRKNGFECLLEIKSSPALKSLPVIRFQFYQLLYNLISNSLKFSDPQRTPHIVISSGIIKGKKLYKDDPTLPAGRLLPKMDYCHLTYIDNGIGFEPEYNERIFEMFQRLHSQEEYTGTGIGLAICKRIVENHRGIITATGTLNGGARFDIYIPVKSHV